jgi:predicted transcriptional regulator
VRANAFLADADRIATELGATECTVRPFPDR